MEQYTYDTFISYRRDGGSEKAQLIKSELIQRGIQEDRIFLDTHSLHDGKFKEKIETAIQLSKSVIVVISKGCFDAVKETDFWYMEIKEALKQNKLIIPIFFDGVTSFSEFNIPEEISGLRELNAVTYHHEFATAVFDKVLIFIKPDTDISISQNKKRGCLFSFKYKGCLISFTLIALLFVVFTPFMLFSPSEKYDKRSPYNDEDDRRYYSPLPDLASPIEMYQSQIEGEWQSFNPNPDSIEYQIIFTKDSFLMESRYHFGRLLYADNGIFDITKDSIFFFDSSDRTLKAKYELHDELLLMSFTFDEDTWIKLWKRRR